MEPNGSCIHEKGPDKEHIGDEYGFHLVTKKLNRVGDLYMRPEELYTGMKRREEGKVVSATDGSPF